MAALLVFLSTVINVYAVKISFLKMLCVIQALMYYSIPRNKIYWQVFASSKVLWRNLSLRVRNFFWIFASHPQIYQDEQPFLAYSFLELTWFNIKLESVKHRWFRLHGIREIDITKLDFSSKVFLTILHFQNNQ